MAPARADEDHVAPVRPTRRLRRATLLAALVCLAAALAPASALAGFGTSFPYVLGNPADKLADRPIEDYAYDYASKCRTRPQVGTLALEAWLERNAKGSFWGIMRCEKLGPKNYSLHAEGRAIDWQLSVRRSADRREAQRLINLLLAPDRLGQPHALARRMGVQEIIWDCRAWWSGSQTLVNYSVCYRGKDGAYKNPGDTLAHRDHIHIGMSNAGARKQTSFWTQGG